MLRALSQVAPRAVYVSANTTTASGLTVTLAKEPRGDVALEAGALVLADQGIQFGNWETILRTRCSV